MATFAPSYQQGSHAEVSDAEARLRLARHGRCPDHPDIQLKKRKGIKWKTVKEECYRCKEEFKLKTQCCPVHPFVIMSKAKKFRCGMMMRHLVCPLCLEGEISVGKTSKNELRRKVDLLTRQYAELASDARFKCDEIENLQSELRILEGKLNTGVTVESTDLLDQLLEKALPMIEDLVAAHERTKPPEPVDHMQTIRANMMKLEARVKVCEGTSQRVVADAMHEVLQQLESLRNDKNMLAIQSEKQRQAFRNELDELQTDLGIVKRTMKELPAQVEWNTDTVKQLLESYSTLEKELESKFAEYDSFIASQKTFNSQIRNQVAALETAVAQEKNITAERLEEMQRQLDAIAKSTTHTFQPKNVMMVNDMSDEMTRLKQRIEVLELELQRRQPQCPSHVHPVKMPVAQVDPLTTDNEVPSSSNAPTFTATVPKCTLKRHKNPVTCCTVFANNTRALNGSWCNAIEVWDLVDETNIATLEGHKNGVNCCTVFANDCRAISGSGDGTLNIWDLVHHKCIATLKGHSSYVTCCAVFANDRRAVSGSWDKFLKVWNLENGMCLTTLKGHTGYVTCCAAFASGTRAISGSYDNTVKVWDLSNGACLTTLKGHKRSVTCCTLFANDTRTLTGSLDATLMVWDLLSGIHLTTLKGHAGSVLCCAVFASDTRVISGSRDQTLKVWDLKKQVCLVTLKGHTDDVTCCTVFAKDTQAVSGSSDSTLKVWQLA